MRVLLFLCLVLSGQILNAQGNKGFVSGKITDTNNLPLSNVSVAVQGGNSGTFSDEQGNYSLKLTAGEYKLHVKSIGYSPADFSIKILNSEVTALSFQLATSSELMQEVIVSGVKFKNATATRILLPIQDIPQSIAVIGQRTIEQQAVIDLSTITRNISGLNFTGNYSGAGSYQFFNARGFDLNDSQNYRWNGMMIWNLGNNYSDNIDQVEFLKGPTSILFGDVSPGGILNLVTKKPLADFMAKAEFKTGSWGLLRPAIDITGSISQDHTLRFRVNSSIEKSNSFRDFVSSTRSFIAPSIAWDITPKLSISAETVFKKSRATDDAGLVSPDGTIKGLDKLDPSLYLGESSRNYLYSDQSYFSKVTYELNKSWRIRSSGFYGNTLNRPFGIWFDQPDTSGDFLRREYGYRQRSRNGSLSLDTYGTFYTGGTKHNILIGVDLQSTHFRYTNAGSLNPLDTNNIYNPVNGRSISNEPAAGPYQPYTSIIERTGFYFQDQILMFNENLHVLLGVRAGRTKQGNNYDEKNLAGTDYDGYADNIITKRILTPRVGLVYKSNTWSSLFFSWSKGYEVNAPDIFAHNYLQYATPPATKSSQLEVGLKANLSDSRFGFTLSAFEINKNNPYGYVYLDPANPNYDEYDIYYKGHHRSRGIEADFDGYLSRDLSMTAGAAYTRTKVMEDPGYPTGNLLPNAPLITANIWLNYEARGKVKGFSVSTGVFFKDKFFSSIANDPKLQIPATYSIDGAFGYRYKQLKTQLNIQNITNRISYLNPWQFNLFDVQPLRHFVITLTYTINPKKPIK